MQIPSFFRQVLCGMLLMTIPLLAQNARAQDDNPRVSNVETAYLSLKTRSEFLHFYLGAGAPTSNSDTKQHWQGIARSPGTGTPYFYLTHSGENTADRHASLTVVEMLSRDAGGGRLRANCLKSDTNPNDQEAPDLDRVVYNYSFTDYNHAGGCQRVGNLLVVPLEENNNSSDPAGKLAFFDLANPRQPLRLATTLTRDHKIGVVAITRLPDTTYLLALTWQDNETVEFFKSSTGNLRDSATTFTSLRSWYYGNLLSGTWYIQTYAGGTAAGGTYQMMNFITKADGTIYLMVARNVAAGGFLDDYLQLFQVVSPTTNAINLQEVVGPRHLYCNGDHGNFAAASGVHVTDAGELLLYSTEYYNTAPNGNSANKAVKVGEFSSIRNGTADSDASSAWITLYEDTGYDGNHLVLDSRDRLNGQWNNLSKMQGFKSTGDFDKKTTSVTWHCPPGTTIRVYENTNYSGASKDFTGDGTLANLGADWNDRISSVQIIAGDPGPTLIVPTPQFLTVAPANQAISLLGFLPYTRLRLLQFVTSEHPTVVGKTLIQSVGTTPSVVGSP